MPVDRLAYGYERVSRNSAPVPMASFHLHPLPPYDFALSAAIFSTGDPDIRIFRDGTYHHALVIDDRPVLLEITGFGSVDEPALNVRIRPGSHDGPGRVPHTGRDEDRDQELDAGGSPGNGDHRGEASLAGALVSAMFNIYDDLTPFYRAIGTDPVMARIAASFHGLKAPTTPTVFEALVDSVIEQQISLSVARLLRARLVRRTGAQLHLDGATWYCYPEPGALANTPGEVFRACGMTSRKGEYIRGIASTVVSGDLDLEGLRQVQDTDAILRELMAIRGVGLWTAELSIIRGIHHLDAFPGDDAGLQRIIGKFYRYGRKVTPGEARTIADAWGPWKGLAAFYLDLAEHLGLPAV